MDPKYGPSFVEQFDVAVNALDNVAARSHVNRNCLISGVPLVESASMGYLGEATVIVKGETQCYDCVPHPTPKKFATCTIRSTPDEPIHCVVWAKYFFSLLFGNMEQASSEMEPGDGESDDAAGEGLEAIVRLRPVSRWTNEKDAYHLFCQAFGDEIERLGSMEELWKRRRKPTPIRAVSSECPDLGAPLPSEPAMADPELCLSLFVASAMTLSERELPLDFEKDEMDCLNFVAAAANARALCFGIAPLNRFDVKAMAGNIIPAIATTNAVVAGLAAVETVKAALSSPAAQSADTSCSGWALGEPQKRLFSQLSRPHRPSGSRLIMESVPDAPNPDCAVCSNTPIGLKVNCSKFTLKDLVELVLKQQAGMTSPDVCDDTGRVLYDEEDEVNAAEKSLSSLSSRSLSDLNVKENTVLTCTDFDKDDCMLQLVIKNSRRELSFVLTGSVKSVCPAEGIGSEPDTKRKADTDVEENDGDSKRRRRLQLDGSSANPNIPVCSACTDSSESRPAPEVIVLSDDEE